MRHDTTLETVVVIYLFIFIFHGFLFLNSYAFYTIGRMGRNLVTWFVGEVHSCPQPKSSSRVVSRSLDYLVF